MPHTLDLVNNLVVLPTHHLLGQEDMEKLEEALLNADIGWELTNSLINKLNSWKPSAYGLNTSNGKNI